MKRQKSLPLIASLISLFSATLVIEGCSTTKTEATPVERGNYLVMAGHCNECHTPKTLGPKGFVLDSKRLLSGSPSDAKLPDVPGGVISPGQWGAIVSSDFTAWAGPWGVSFPYNLTPHPASGTGNWGESLFIQTLRSGKFMGTSRDMLPPMPWQEIGNMTDSDLKAIFAYLKSLPPVDNPIPAPIPPPQP